MTSIRNEKDELISNCFSAETYAEAALRFVESLEEKGVMNAKAAISDLRQAIDLLSSVRRWAK